MPCNRSRRDKKNDTLYITSKQISLVVINFSFFLIFEKKKNLTLCSVYRRYPIDLVETRKMTPYMLVPNVLIRS